MFQFFLHKINFKKDVLNNLSFSHFWETLFRLRAELFNTDSRARLPALQHTVHFCRINTEASWSLSLQGKTDTTSKARYSLKAPWDHTLSLTSKKVSTWIFLMGLTWMNYSNLPPMPLPGKWIYNAQMVIAKCYHSSKSLLVRFAVQSVFWNLIQIFYN